MNPFLAALSRWIERILWLVAIVGVGIALYGYGQGWIWQSYLNRQFDQAVAKTKTSGVMPRSAALEANRPSPIETDRTDVTATSSAAVPYIGKLEIRRLDISAMILEGDDGSTLLRGIGHIPGTAQPGERGNVGIAGHRDTFFRHLGRIQKDDQIIVRTTAGTYEYTVESIHIVSPNYVEVLDTTNNETLTLVTCYPFSFLGPAPERFVVQAFRAK